MALRSAGVAGVSPSQAAYCASFRMTGIRSWIGEINGEAAVVTIALVVGLTLIAFTTKKDFSFLGGILKIGGMIGLGVIVASFFLPITLGTWFSALMILFAAGSILYNTSNIMFHYRTSQYVAASLSLFASVALLFWYVLRLFMSRD